MVEAQLHGGPFDGERVQITEEQAETVCPDPILRHGVNQRECVYLRYTMDPEFFYSRVQSGDYPDNG